MAQVLVVDRNAFFGGDWPQGFHAIEDSEAFLERATKGARYEDRPTAERTPAWKQWIPYCLLRCGDWRSGPEAERGVFVVRRTRGQSEARLHESRSLGIGGHIEPVDGLPQASDQSARAFFEAALDRELTEELQLPADVPRSRPELLGLINDDATEVGQVHAGLAFRIDVALPLAEAQARVGIREISKMHGGFTSLVEFADLWQTPSSFESWSQLLVQAGFVDVMGARTWHGTTDRPTPGGRDMGSGA